MVMAGFGMAAAVLLSVDALALSTNRLVFQDGSPPFSGAEDYAGTEDTYLNGQDATAQTYNYGSKTTLQIRDRTADSDALLRFTGIGSGLFRSSVTSATRPCARSWRNSL